MERLPDVNLVQPDNNLAGLQINQPSGTDFFRGGNRIDPTRWEGQRKQLYVSITKQSPFGPAKQPCF
jgi:hypothetical protein